VKGNGIVALLSCARSGKRSPCSSATRALPDQAFDCSKALEPWRVVQVASEEGAINQRAGVAVQPEYEHVPVAIVSLVVGARRVRKVRTGRPPVTYALPSGATSTSIATPGRALPRPGRSHRSVRPRPAVLGIERNGEGVRQTGRDRRRVAVGRRSRVGKSSESVWPVTNVPGIVHRDPVPNSHPLPPRKLL
jgi:hypothetical protein